MSDTEPLLSEANIRRLITECLHTDEELAGYTRAAFDGEGVKYPEGSLIVEGVVRSFVFHHGRLQSKRDEVSDMLNELIEGFREGQSFLEMCTDKNGHQWTGLQLVMEDLMCLAIGLGLMEYCAPRTMWVIFPGSMPYVRIKQEVTYVPR